MKDRLRAWAETRTAPVLFAFGADAPLEQMARYDAWRVEGEGAVLGVGLGEVAAAYAAGSLSRADAVAVVRALERLHPNGTAAAVAFVVAADSETAKRLCRRAPVRLEFAGARSPGEAVLVCAAADVATARRHVEATAPIRAERDAGGAWHTTRVCAAPAHLPNVAPRRAERPVYAAAAGGKVAEELTDGRYWHWLVRRPFYLDEAATAAVDDGYLLVVDVANDRDLRAAIETVARARGRGVRILDRPPGSRRTRRRPSRPGPPSLLDPKFQEELRRDGPVHYVADDDVWLVLGYDEARTVLAHPECFSSQPYAVNDRSLLSLDPPDHKSPRRALRDVFSPGAVAELAELSERTAAELVESVADEVEFDVLARIAQPLTERVIAQMLGIAPSAVAEVAMAAAGGGLEPDVALTGETIARLPHPPTLTARLAAAPGMNAEQAASLVQFLWVAGIVTTRQLIGVAVLTLCEDEDTRRRVTEDPDLLPAFVEETLRLRPPQHLFPRVAVTDTSLAGVRIPAGADVRVSPRAANRDPRRFPDPDRLRLDRPPQHLAFGAGPHRCPGARLGRVEAVAALRAILHAMPDITLVQPPATIRWLQPPHLPVLEELVVAPRSAG